MADLRLEVNLHGRHIGILTPAPRLPRSRVRLTWDDDYVPGDVRLTESFSAFPGTTPDMNLVSNFLGGYTPEGNQRSVLARERGLDRDDLFGLLREFGGSIAGALTFTLPGEDPAHQPRYDAITSTQLGKLLRKAVEEHDLGVQSDSRSMIPGFQPKVLLASFDDEQWLQPHGRAHSTHLLKPQLSSRPSKLYDEWYSHELSRHMGLSSFRSEIRIAGSQKYLSVERFDRLVSGETITLVHQEDVAQALGVDWVDAESKFQAPEWPSNPKRPSLYRAAEVIATLSDPASLETWLRQVTYRVLVGDNDGHAKNIGILHRDGSDTLTELYDAVPNLYQDGLVSWNMAFAIDGEFDHRKMSVERIAAEADSWGVLGRRQIENIIWSVVHDFEDALNAVAAPRGLSEGLQAGLEWSAGRMTAGKEISERKR